MEDDPQHLTAKRLLRSLRTLLTGVLLFCLELFIACGNVSAGQLLTVDYVIDGDTVILNNDEKVRLIGINAPEKENGSTPAQPFSLEARLALIELVDKQRVRLVIGKEPRDRYGRMLAYLMLTDGTDVQKELIRRGYAMVVAFPPNLKFLEDYAQAEAEARGAGRGIWRDSYYSVQNIDLGKLVSDGFNRISGKVTSVSRSRKNVRITVSNNLTILIYHRVWKEFWRGQDPQKLVGRQITSRGWVWSWQTEKLMRVQHPFMLQGIDH